MKVIEIEGIRLTEEMIERIGYFQMDEGKGIGDFMKLIDKIIRYIAINGDDCCDAGKIEAFELISELSQHHDMLSCFSGKEEEE